MAHEFGIPIGAGSFEKRGKNRWRIRFSLGKNPKTGKYEYSPAINVNGSKTDARIAAEKYKTELIRKATEDNSELLLGEYIDQWQRGRLASPGIKQATCDRDRPILSLIKKYFGSKAVASLSTADIKRGYVRALERDEISPSKYHMMHQKLKQILDDAVSEGVIESNPAANKVLKAPRPECKSRKSLSASESKRLAVCPHDASEESRFMAVLIGLATGARRGEVLGLQWKHMHLSADPGQSSISIEQQLVKKSRGYEKPKTRSSERTISIDDETALRLIEWRSTQAEALKILGIAQTPQTPVITDSEGGTQDPANFYGWFTRFCEKHGFGAFYDDEGNRVDPPTLNEHGFPVDSDGRPYSRSNRRPKISRHYRGLKFHELRHTNISLMIANGIDFRTASERAGHAKVSTTMDIYSHAFPENDRAAAKLIGSLLS